MSPIAILVEGQTEAAFVNKVLQLALNPSAEPDGVWLQPTVVHTGKTASGTTYKGGGSSWKHYGRHLRALFAGSHFRRVALLMDLYAYPRDAPGADIAASDPRERHAGVLAALKEQYPDPRFVPGIMLHEFETLVIASAVGRTSLLMEREPIQCLREVAAAVSDDVELINDGPQTAPSHRVKACWPDYDKAVDGVAAVGEAGIGHVRALCPAFDDWLRRLTA